MDREQARNELRGHLAEYLAEFHGVQNPKRLFRCISPEHEDRNPSMSFHEAHNRVHCFSCGYTADIIDLIKRDWNLATDREAFAWGYDHYRIFVDDKSSFPVIPSYRPTPAPVPKGQQIDKLMVSDKQYENQAAYFSHCRSLLDGGRDYLAQRGISLERAKEYGLGFDPVFDRNTGGKKWGAIIIPTGMASYVARNTDSNADKKDRIRNYGNASLFNPEALMEDRPVFVVEGAFDALSVIEAGGAAVALDSTANTRVLLEYLDAHEEARPKHKLQISLDNDDAGEKAARELIEGLGGRGIPARQVNISGSCKDPNEALIADKSSFIGAVQEAELYEDEARKKERDDYFRLSASGSMGDFLSEVERNKSTPPISTGFLELDQVLGGGLYEGLILIGAISSLGKTALILQIADSIARGDERQAGRDVLFVALEMSKFELMARSISRETFEGMDGEEGQSGSPKTMRQILNGQGDEFFNEADRTVIRNAMAVYSQYGDRIFFVEGIGDVGVTKVRADIEKHIRITGQVPVVIVDYFQLLIPDDSHMTDKQVADRNILELKKISRDFRTPVIVVSSFNRASYKNPVVMEAFKESGSLEYSSDVLIGLQLAGAGEQNFDVDAAKRQDPRQVEAVVLKNRSGRTGDKLKFDFYPGFNYFEERLEESLDPEKVARRREFYKGLRKRAHQNAGSFYSLKEEKMAVPDGNFQGVDLKKADKETWENYKLAACEFGDLNDKGEFCGLRLEAWRPVFRKYSTASGDKAKDRQFDKAREALRKAGRIRVENDVYWPDGFLCGNEVKSITEKLMARRGKDQQIMIPGAEGK